MQQLELPLWEILNEAAVIPEDADLQQLWLSLDATIAPLSTRQQLQVAGDAIATIAQIVQQRSLLTLEEIDSMMQDEGPVVATDFFDKFVRQSVHVDFAQFVVPPPPLPRQVSQRSRREFPNDGRSVVGLIDKAALLEAINLEPEFGDEVTPAQALAVAHPEDVSTWVDAIERYFAQRHSECLPLLTLVCEVQYPIIQEEDKGSPLVKTWLAVLLGGFVLEQGQDFYEIESIRVSMP